MKQSFGARPARSCLISMHWVVANHKIEDAVFRPSPARHAGRLMTRQLDPVGKKVNSLETPSYRRTHITHETQEEIQRHFTPRFGHLKQNARSSVARALRSAASLAVDARPNECGPPLSALYRVERPSLTKPWKGVRSHRHCFGFGITGVRVLRRCWLPRNRRRLYELSPNA